MDFALVEAERLSVDKWGQPCIGDPQPPTTIFEEGCPHLSRVGARPMMQQRKYSVLCVQIKRKNGLWMPI
jgi:hypothetical protein